MRLFCLFMTLMLALAPSLSAQVDYYVERGRVVTPVIKGHPEREHPSDWRIRLYTPGSSTSGPGWGEMIGQSADDAQEELRRSQQFAERLRKFCPDGSHDETLLYSNTLGPIAVYQSAGLPEGKAGEPAKKGDSESPQNEAFDLADRISELEKEFLAVTDERRVKANPSRYPFAPASAPCIFATKLAATKAEFEKSNALASARSLSSGDGGDMRTRIKNALTELETNLLPPMRKALANVTLEGTWKHRGITYVSVRSGRQLSLKADTPDGLHFRNINIDSDTSLSGEIEFVYDNGCEPVWSLFTAELTFDTDAEGILISVPRVGRERSTCRQVTQGTMRMMFWRPEQ